MAETGGYVMYYMEYDAPMGKLILTSDGHCLTKLGFADGGFRPSGEKCRGGEGRFFGGAVEWLDAYFGGEVPRNTPDMAPEGTAFQKLVWKLLLEIPCGEVRTYGQLAAQAAASLGRERMSAQAVGQAVGANPIAIIIPCHRCVGAGGRLAGYAWGVERKQWLLQHERNHMEDKL